MSVRDYIKNIAPPRASVKAIREDAARKGTGSLSMREIDRIVATVRRQRNKKTRRSVK